MVERRVNFQFGPETINRTLRVAPPGGGIGGPSGGRGLEPRNRPRQRSVAGFKRPHAGSSRLANGKLQVFRS
jgi:hypothetical protein